MSKGSGRRPQQVPDEQVGDAWEKIFGQKCQDCGKPLGTDHIHTCSPQKGEQDDRATDCNSSS